MDRGARYIDAGRKKSHDNPQYGLTMGELTMFVNMAADKSIYDAIGNAFYLGLEAGTRLAKRTQEE